MDARAIEILQAIQSGKRSFRPRSQSESDMVDFQAVAKALVYLDSQDYLDGCRPHKESSTGNRWYDAVEVTNGLTYSGEQLMKELVPTGDMVSAGLARQLGLPSNHVQPAVGPRITMDTNCVINAFDANSPSATSVTEIMTLLRYSMSGRITVAITTRVEKDLLNDRDQDRRATSLRTLDAFPVIGTVGRMDVSRWDGGDVFSDERLARLREEIQQTIFPGLQPTDRRYENRRNE